jgi:hypothetical protein
VDGERKNIGSNRFDLLRIGSNRFELPRTQWGGGVMEDLAPVKLVRAGDTQGGVQVSHPSQGL